MNENGKSKLGFLGVIGSLSLFVAFAIIRFPVFSLSVVRMNEIAVEGSWFVYEWFELIHWETLFPMGVSLKIVYCAASIVGTICLILFFAGLGKMLYKTEDRKVLIPVVSSIVGGAVSIIAYLGVLSFTLTNVSALEGTIPAGVINAIGAQADIVIPPLTILLVFGGLLMSVFGVGLFSYQNPRNILPRPIRILGMITGVFGIFWLSSIPILDLSFLMSLQWILLPVQYINVLGFLLMLEWLFLAGFKMTSDQLHSSIDTPDVSRDSPTTNRALSLVLFFTGILVLISTTTDLIFPLASPRAAPAQFLIDWNNTLNLRTIQSLIVPISLFMILLAVTLLYMQIEGPKGKKEKLQIVLVHFGALIAAKSIIDMGVIKYIAVIIDDAPPATIPGILAATEQTIANGMFPLALGGILILTLGVGFIALRAFNSSETRNQRILGVISALLGFGFIGLLFGEPVFSIALIVAKASGVILPLWMFAVGALYCKKPQT